MSHIVWFTDEAARHRDRVGGKGANLGRLANAGLPVPPGFVVPTDAYSAFMTASGIGDKLGQLLTGCAVADPESLEQSTDDIRALILESALSPALERAIDDGYRRLGSDSYVAVRSSGTAEDTAEFSFAGLHDTYLDVCGRDELLAAVRRCWASLFTARAVAYRQDKGYDHATVSLAVVVQSMVESEVAGVMFTANPVSGATDETLVNASWGLGEAVVSGVVTPDEFVLAHATMAVRRERLGDKNVEIVRDRERGCGTLTREVGPDRRERACLTVAQLRELGLLGSRLSEHYGRMPQDIEWALADGQFHVLQSRDVTGVTLAWDEDVDGWQQLPDDEDDVWTRAFADEWWTGAITPLFYSIRAHEHTECHIQVLGAMGLPAEAGKRVFKYHRAEAYWNATVETMEAPQFIPGFLRGPGMFGRMPSSFWPAAQHAPFSWRAWVLLNLRLMRNQPNMGPTRWIEWVYDQLDNHIADADGRSDEELAAMDDAALKSYLDERIQFFIDFNKNQWAGFFVYAPNLLTLLGYLLGRWYTGTNPQVFADLMTGLPRQTITLKENEQIWHLAQLIRHSDGLRALFNAHPGERFFLEARGHPEAAEFLASHAALLAEHGHRGQADRDIWFPRRIENPTGDYNALASILTADPALSPAAAEAATQATRDAATRELMANLRSQRYGRAKTRVIQLVLDQAYKFLVVRDDERHYIDRITWAKKRALLEINRRLRSRGALHDDQDIYFLAKHELYQVLDGTYDDRLTQTKIAGRRAHFGRFDRKEAIPPACLHRGTAADFDTPNPDQETLDGVLRGIGTSRGTVTGPARVIRGMHELGRVAHGDIMVCQATDPGWTPVFLVIGGLVLETGGMLAHGSCLSREYGLPAVQIRDAMNLIEDGAMITVNGETGEITIGQPDRPTAIEPARR